MEKAGKMVSELNVEPSSNKINQTRSSEQNVGPSSHESGRMKSSEPNVGPSSHESGRMKSSEPNVGPSSHESGRMRSSEPNSGPVSLARSDSGQGKSVTSQDLADEDNLQNTSVDEECITDSPHSDDIPLLDNCLCSQNCEDSNDHVPLPRYSCLAPSNNNRICTSMLSSTNVHSIKPLWHQYSLNTNQNPEKVFSLGPGPNISSLENDNPIWFKSSVIGSPDRSLECTEDFSQTSLQITKGDADSTVQALPCDPQPTPSTVHPSPSNPRPEASPQTAQLFSKSNAPSTTTTVAANVQRCLSEPAPTSPTSVHAAGFSSLPVSHMGVVSKEVMDQLVKELVRERLKVRTLQQVNHQLYMNVDRLEKIHQTQAGTIREAAIKIDTLKSQANDHIPFLLDHLNHWKQKCQERDKEISSKQQEIEQLQKRFSQVEHELTSQLNSVKERLLHEQHEKDELTKTMDGLRTVLRTERNRFARDETTLRERVARLSEEVKELEHVNQWLREGHESMPLATIAEVNTYADLQVIPRDQSSLHMSNGSGETHPKEVYPENAVQLNHSTSHIQGARSKEGARNHNGVRGHENFTEEKCSNCYKMLREFNSNEEFEKHKNICES